MAGTEFNSTATTNRCRQVDREGSGVRVTAVSTSKVTAPSTSRSHATPTGVSDRRPSRINKKEQPQNRASSKKADSQDHVGGATPVEVVTRSPPRPARRTDVPQLVAQARATARTPERRPRRSATSV